MRPIRPGAFQPYHYVSLSTPLNIWYLDDGTVGGSADQVLDDFNTPISISRIGAKPCEIRADFLRNGHFYFRCCALKISVYSSNNKSSTALLGAPLTSETLSPLLQSKTSVLKHMVTRLRLLDAHDAVYLLRNFCTSPIWSS